MTHGQFDLKLAATTSVFVAASIVVSSPSAHANGGIVFDEVAAELGYRRGPAANFDQLTTLLEQSQVTPLAFSTIPEVLPGRVRGVPGVALLDYDGDGDLDIYVTNGPGRTNSLFQNQLVPSGLMSFIDVGSQAGAGADDMDSWGVCYGDLDNDGDEDLIVTGNGEPNRLYVNDGAGGFDFDATSGLGGGNTSTTGCGVGDIDGDGLLDVSFVNNWDQKDFAPCFRDFLVDEAQHNQLFRNLGGNAFADVSETSGIQVLLGNRDAAGNPLDIPGITWGHAMADVDLDGDIDILYADDQCEVLPVKQGGAFDRGYVHVMLNDGTGTFQDHPIVEMPQSSTTWMSIALGDYNCDGNLDMFLSSFGDYAFNNIGVPNDIGDHASRWVLGRGDGSFEDPGVGDELVGTPFGWGNAPLDYDNDGDQDVVFIGGLDQLLVNQSDNPGALLSNEECTGTFVADIPAIPTEYQRHNVQGLAAGDLDQDGFPDFVTASNLRIPDSAALSLGVPIGGPFDATANFFLNFFPTDATLAFWEWQGTVYGEGELTIELNSGDNGNRWIAVQSVGTVGITDGGQVNRDGIGAIAIVTPHGGQSVMRPVHVGNYTSAHSREGTFGLGDAQLADVETRWPGGVRNKLLWVSHAQRMTIPEIPCSFDGDFASLGAYVQCVVRAVVDIEQAGIVGPTMGPRLVASAIVARLEFLAGD